MNEYANTVYRFPAVMFLNEVPEDVEIIKIGRPETISVEHATDGMINMLESSQCREHEGREKRGDRSKFVPSATIAAMRDGVRTRIGWGADSIYTRKSTSDVVAYLTQGRVWPE